MANTVQTLLTGGGSSSISNERRPMSSMGTDSTSAMTSMPRPVPAAHLSFMMKFSTLPRSSQRITLQSWPPMSRMVRMLGPPM